LEALGVTCGTDAPDCTKAIQQALGSTDRATRLAALVGQAVNDPAVEDQVVAFQKGFGGPGSPIGEIDVETENVIIEVTTGNAGKVAQLQNLLGNPLLNPSAKQVLLFAPNYGKFATQSAEDIGVRVIKSFSDLQSYLNGLANQS
jgi:hypothetical protein